MLKRSRNETMQAVLSKLRYGLDSPNMLNPDGPSYLMPTNGKTYSTYNGHYSPAAILTPSEAQGWPPELAEYIHRMVMVTAMAIVESIYTEEELDGKVDGILLDSEPTAI